MNKKHNTIVTFLNTCFVAITKLESVSKICVIQQSRIAPSHQRNKRFSIQSATKLHEISSVVLIMWSNRIRRIQNIQ